MKRKRLLILLLILMIGTAILIFYPKFGDYKISDTGAMARYLDDANAWLEDFGFFRYLTLFFIQVFQVIVAIIPGEPVELLAGFVLGTVGGTLLCIIGSAIGACIIFWGVHRFGQGFIAFFTGKKFYDRLSFLKDPVRRDMFLFVLFLIPGTPKDLLLYFSPLTNITLWRLVFIISIARIPSIMSSTYVGAHVSEGEFGHSLVVFAITGIVGLAGILINDMILQHREKAKRKS